MASEQGHERHEQVHLVAGRVMRNGVRVLHGSLNKTQAQNDTWVGGDVAEMVVQFVNHIPVEMKVPHMSLLKEGVPLVWVVHPEPAVDPLKEEGQLRILTLFWVGIL